MTSSAVVSLGLDIGSTTVKAVAMSADGRVLVSHVARHHGALRIAVRRAVQALDLGAASVRVYLTGSGARGISLASHSTVVHEVSATAAAVRARHPDVRSVIEMGGQDAKLLRLDRGVDGSVTRVDATMNDRCAAGTGVTLDRCLLRLGENARGLLAARFDPARVHAVSTKCGVFAETDIANLVRRGISAEDAVISLADALVLQTLAVLARGRAIEPKVLLLGGPAFHFRALTGAWRHHLARTTGISTAEAERLVEVPDDALLYAAIGACIAGAARREAVGCDVRTLVAETARASAKSTPPRDPAFGRDPVAPPPRAPWQPTRGRSAGGYSMGIDAGSTRFKGVALDEHADVIASVERSSGDPAEDALWVRDALRDRVRAIAGSEALVVAVGVTGYGTDAVGALLGGMPVVETVAHARAARAAVPDVDVVCDVGGQDIKVLMLDAEGALRDFRLSGQCYAGIGLAMESSARELGISLAQYANVAARARRAPTFGDGCVVFLDADRVTFQRQGFRRDEILAGLARALPRIVFERVLAGVAIESLGRTFVLSGGVQENAAAAIAMSSHVREHVPDARVWLHPFPSLAGAIGAALVARDEVLADRVEPSSRAGSTERDEIVALHSADAPRCDLCASHCPRTFVRAQLRDGGTRLHVVGNACDAGAAPTPDDAARSHVRRRAAALPDLFVEESRRLFAPTRAAKAEDPPRRTPRIGIPRVLGMYRAAPFFRGYLAGLGVPSRNVVFSPPTSDALWREAGARGATDPCFPAKVVLAHVARLVDARRIEMLLMPAITHALTRVTTARECASCPVVACAPLLVRDAIDRLGSRARSIELVDGPVTLTDPALLHEQMHALLGERLGADRARSDAAVALGLREMRSLDDVLRARASRVLDALAGDSTRAAVLVLARPYHADEGIHHRVTAEVVACGFPVLSLRSLPTNASLSPPDVRDLVPDATNSGALERLWGARYAARHGQLAVLDLSSFKCAQDSVTAAPVRSLLDGAGVVTCALHDLDETRPVTSFRTRIRTFAHALSQRGFLPWTARSSSPA